MGTLSALFEAIGENLDQRRLEFTNIRRVVLKFAGGPLEPAAARMAIPMIYAVWEGFVKEVCQLYLEYVEQSVSKAAHLQPAILGHMWTPQLRRLTGSLDFSKKKSIAEVALAIASTPVEFHDAERDVNTKSNLNYAVLEDIARHLCLDISNTRESRASLNALVNLRNNIAHGARPTGLSYVDIDAYARSTLSLMEAFETALSTAARSRAFCNASHTKQGV